MEATDRGACKDVTGFSPYEKRGQGQYSRDNLMSHSAADIAATYVVKALGKSPQYVQIPSEWYFDIGLHAWNRPNTLSGS